MRAFIKYLIVLLLVILTVAIIFKITTPVLQPTTNPDRIPTYAEVVPAGFSALGTPTILDFREISPLLHPRLGIVRVSDNIVTQACLSGHPECKAKALYAWTKQYIIHTDVLPTKQYIIGPEETILYREGNDLTLSILLASFLKAEGLQARIAKSPYVTFVETNIQGNNVSLDPGCGGCGFGIIRYNGDYSNVQFIE